MSFRLSHPILFTVQDISELTGFVMQQDTTSMRLIPIDMERFGRNLMGGVDGDGDVSMNW
jgi:hypothetical protein